MTSHNNPPDSKMESVESKTFDYTIPNTIITSPDSPTFNFSLSSSKPILIIPSLDDILENTIESSNTPYNRVNFVKFLSLSHCLENLEFIIELNNFIKLLGNESGPHNYNLINWQMIYKNFLLEDSLKEINIPYHLKNQFNYDDIPPVPSLLKIKSVIFELLHDSYNEFIKYVKANKINNANNYRRKSEIVPPEFNDSFPPFNKIIPRSSSNVIEDDLAPISSLNETNLSRYNQNNHPPTQPPALQQQQNTPASSSSDHTSSRHNSAPSSSSSRGSSLGSIVENLKNHEYVNWKKTVKKFKIRRHLNDEQE